MTLLQNSMQTANISEALQYRHIITAPWPLTLDDIEGHHLKE